MSGHSITINFVKHLQTTLQKMFTEKKIITVGEHSSDITALVYVKGTTSNPIVAKIVKISRGIKNKIFISDVLEELMKYDGQGYREASRYVESVYGERLFDEYKSADFKSLSQLQRERKGSLSSKNNENNRSEQNGAGSTRTNTEISKAGVDTSAFSNAEKSKSTDTQYSKQNDLEYLELAKEPEKNEAKLRELVDEVAKENGYKKKHGNKNAPFRVHFLLFRLKGY